jgi:uncharacterized membrane protein
MIKHTGEYLAVFLFGFFLYALIEISSRGYTHWTMGLLGGTALTVLYSMEDRLRASVWVHALFGTLFITAAEFTVGVLDNLIMGWHVWDYSNRAFNLLGQICPMFSVIWYVLCLPACLFCRRLYRRHRALTDEATE